MYIYYCWQRFWVNNYPEVYDAYIYLLLTKILRQQLPWGLRCLHLSFVGKDWVNSYAEVQDFDFD